MAQGGMIGNDAPGPVAESVDAGAVQCSLSWFKSRPGLQPTPLARLRLGEPPWPEQRLVAPKLEERRRKRRRTKAPLEKPAKPPYENQPNCRLMAALKPFRGCETWSKDRLRARGKPGALARGTRGMRALFLCPNSNRRD